MNFFHRHSYVIFSIILIVYIVVQTRSSYLGPYVTMILWMVAPAIYKLRTNKTFTIWVGIMFFYWLIGLINMNPSNYVIQDMVAFFPFVLLLSTNMQFRGDYLRNQAFGFRRLLPIYAILYLVILNYMGFNVYGSDVSRFDYNQDVHLVLTAPLAPLLFVRYLICYNVEKKNLWHTGWLVVCILFFFHFAIITATKSILMPILVVLVLKLILNQNITSRLKYGISILIVASFVTYFAQDYFNESLFRFMEKFEVKDDSNTSRLDESIQYLSQCNTFQLLFGKGFGGLKTFHGESFIGGESMIHLGFCYLIMKGGILLLGLMYFPLLAIIIKDIRSGRYEYALIAFCLLMQDLGHQFWQSFLTVSVYWLLVYYRFYNRNWHEKVLKYEHNQLKHNNSN